MSVEESKLPPFERAAKKIQAFGFEAELLLDEAAAVVDFSPSQYERLEIPDIPWSKRGRRWRYGTIVERARELEKQSGGRWRFDPSHERPSGTRG